MADAESLLGQQLSAAVRIPYENIDRINDPVSKFMTAWQLSSNLKLKKAELEQQAMALASRNRELDFNEQMRMKEYGLDVLKTHITAANENTRLNLEAKRIAQEGTLGQERIDTIYAKFDNQHEKDMNRADAQQALYALDADLDEQGFARGSRERETEYTKRVGEITRNLSPSEINAVYKTTHGNLLAQAKIQQQLDENEMRSFKERMGSELFGDPRIQDLKPILDPNRLWDDWKKEGKWPYVKTVMVPGQKRIDYTDLQTGITKNVGSAPLSRLLELNKEYKDMLERQSHTSPANRPPPPNIPTQHAIPMPADKSKMVKDQTYEVPGQPNPMRWTGTGLVPAQ